MNIETMQSWLDERSILRNTVLNDETFYNKLGKAVSDLWLSEKVSKIEEDVRLFEANSLESYVMIFEKEKRRISIFSVKPNKSPNIKALKEVLVSSSELNKSDFIFSIIDADFETGISPEQTLNNIKSLTDDKENAEKI